MQLMRPCYTFFMRTTISIDDGLLEAAKKRAAQRSQTLGQYVEDAVRQSLVEPRSTSAEPEIPTFGGGGDVKAGLDLTSNRSLYDALDDDALGGDGVPK